MGKAPGATVKDPWGHIQHFDIWQFPTAAILAERATLTAIRKECYEFLHPETVHGATLKKGDAPSRQLGDSAADRFTADTAETTGRAERSYGEMYAQAVDATGYENGTLRTAKWVAGAYELSLRKDNLSFKHHRIVAALPTRTARQRATDTCGPRRSIRLWRWSVIPR